MANQNLSINNDHEILSVTSPQKNIGGPYKVVYKDIQEQWAIVALDWDNFPRLGIRWFNSPSGNPVSRGYPTWFMIPEALTKPILNSLPINHAFSNKVDDYLAGKISGQDL